MPEPDGIETTKRLRGIGYTGIIVALTANAVVGQAEMFLQNGFDEFISKPIDIRQLNTVLNKHIRDKQSQETLDKAQRLKSEQEVFVIDGHLMDIPGIDDRFVNNDNISDRAGFPNLQSIKIEGIDLIRGLMRYEDDTDVYLGIIRSYTGSIKKILFEIENVYENDLADYKIKIHGIKGASFDIFAEKTGNAAKALEMAASAGDYDFIEKNNPGFIEETRRLIDDLEKMLSDLVGGEVKTKKYEPDPMLLSKLADSCKTFNLNAAEEVMDELDRFEYDKDNDLILWLRENIDIMNFTAITKKLTD